MIGCRARSAGGVLFSSHQLAVERGGMFAAPVVSFVAEANSAMSAGYSVTVSGVSFGADAVTPTATFGTTGCRTSAWASTTSVVCLPHAGESVAVDVHMTAHGVVGTRTAAFSYDGCPAGARLPLLSGLCTWMPFVCLTRCQRTGMAK